MSEWLPHRTDFSLMLDEKVSRYTTELNMLNNGSHAYIWGSKMVGRATAEYMLSHGFHNISFIDANSILQGGTVCGFPVLSPDMIPGDDGVVIVGSGHYQQEIIREILSRGIRHVIPYYSIDILLQKKKYIDLFEQLGDSESRKNLSGHIQFRLTGEIEHIDSLRSSCSQYFEKGIIVLTDSECFVDGGGYNGDTFRDFFYECSGHFKKYHLFEPNISLINAAKQSINDNRVVFHNTGLYSSHAEMPFFETLEMNGHILEPGIEGIRVSVSPLDEIISEKITFYKLDVEGSELAALSGSKKHIQNDHPKLAISVYHRPDDLIAITEYIQSLVPGYSFFIRSYGERPYEEIILYAVFLQEGTV